LADSFLGSLSKYLKLRSCFVIFEIFLYITLFKYGILDGSSKMQFKRHDWCCILCCLIDFASLSFLISALALAASRTISELIEVLFQWYFEFGISKDLYSHLRSLNIVMKYSWGSHKYARIATIAIAIIYRREFTVKLIFLFINI